MAKIGLFTSASMLAEKMLRVVLYLKDSSNLRITELWADKILKKYSYYWLNPNVAKAEGAAGLRRQG